MFVKACGAAFALLALAAPAAEAQSGWDRYQPRSPAGIIELQIVWDEVPRGSTAELFVLYVGAYLDGPTADWLFVVTGV